MKKTAESIGLNREAAALGAACLAAYGLSLRARELFHDDWIIIGNNPFLRQGLRGAARLAATGYWEAVSGKAALVQEYRPLLMWTFLLQTSFSALASAAAMHAVNILVHFAACFLFLQVLKRHLAARQALIGALLFTVIPVHTEAVNLLTGRSELLSAAWMLAAWLCLEPGRKFRLGPGLGLFAAALLTKESSILFPAALALADWSLFGLRPWAQKRRGLYAWLGLESLAYLLLRQAVLGRDFSGGVPYFHSRLTALATLPGFMLKHYLWPSISGLDLCTDFTRPLIPDASFLEPAVWLSFILVAGTLCAAARACYHRKAWGFAVLGPLLFLLPTCHLLMPLDTIGAQRFLYVPTLGAAALAGAWLGGLKPRILWPILILLTGFYCILSARRSLAWTTGEGYYAQAAACNPVSGRAQSGRGASLLADGKLAEGRQSLEQAIAINPQLAGPYYNLARLAWQQGNPAETEKWASQAVSRDPTDADSWTLLAVALEAQNRDDSAADCLGRALSIWPDSAEAHYNLGRLLLKKGRQDMARRHFERFLDLSPQDPQAPAIARLLAQMKEPR